MAEAPTFCRFSQMKFIGLILETAPGDTKKSGWPGVEKNLRLSNFNSPKQFKTMMTNLSTGLKFKTSVPLAEIENTLPTFVPTIGTWKLNPLSSNGAKKLPPSISKAKSTKKVQARLPDLNQDLLVP